MDEQGYKGRFLNDSGRVFNSVNCSKTRRKHISKSSQNVFHTYGMVIRTLAAGSTEPTVKLVKH